MSLWFSLRIAVLVRPYNPEFKIIFFRYGLNLKQGFSGPSHDQEESNVIAILLHCIEEEMHYSVRHGAFQASCHSDPMNLRDCFCICLSSNCLTDLTTYHVLPLLSVARFLHSTPGPLVISFSYIMVLLLIYYNHWCCWKLSHQPSKLYADYLVCTF
jgi:hypothetical protein